MTLIAGNANFDYVSAVEAAALSNAAYLDGSALGVALINLGWDALVSQHSSYVSLDHGGLAANGTELQILGAGGAFAFAATREIGGETDFVISFRGSNNIFSGALSDDWISNNLGDHGFSRYYRALRPLVEETFWQAMQAAAAGQDVRIVLTGHSLGGAAVQAALLDLLIPKTEDVWAYQLLPQPLDEGDRIGQSTAAIQAYGAQDWDSRLGASGLLDRTVSYTYGAPSITMDDVVDYNPITGFSFGLGVVASERGHGGAP